MVYFVRFYGQTIFFYFYIFSWLTLALKKDVSHNYWCATLIFWLTMDFLYIHRDMHVGFQLHVVGHLAIYAVMQLVECLRVT